MIGNCAIIGAGAIGASLGELLCRSYDTVRIIADGERAGRYARDGIRINDTLWIPPTDEGTSPYDLVIIAVKFNQFHEILPVVDRMVGEHTQILSLLNGLATEEILIERYGDEHVLYGFTVGQDARREGNSIIYTLMGRIVFGERVNTLAHPTQRVAEIRTYLQVAGVEVVVPEDMAYELWWKFMVNVGVNQASAYLNAPFGVFQAGGEALDLMIELCREVMRLSESTAHPLKEEDLSRWIELLMTLDPQGRTSMLQDFDARRRSELELFAGTVLEKAAQAGIDVPVNRKVYEALSAREGAITD